MKRSWHVPFCALSLVFTVVACSPRDEAPPSAEDDSLRESSLNAERTAELDRLRGSLQRFRDVEVALAEGYVPDPMNICETSAVMGFAPELGAMGIHYFRPDLLQITATEPRVDGTGTHTDFDVPAVLIYEPQADGSMELVAVENLAFRRAWGAAGYAEPPSFLGVSYDYMEDDPATEPDEGHYFEPHYDLHVWLYRDNPNGTFTQFNPAVTCEHHSGGAAHAH